jgi:hypothetical protein
MRAPYRLYRPEKNGDGMGGTAFTVGGFRPIYGILSLYQSEPVLTAVPSAEDVQINDIITEWSLADQYRVIGFSQLQGMQNKTVLLEKVKSPVVPTE